MEAPVMDNYRRKLLLRVWAGENRLLPSLHMINEMVRAEDVLRALLRQRLTGTLLLEWLDEHATTIDPLLKEHKRFSPVKFYSALLALVGKDGKLNIRDLK